LAGTNQHLGTTSWLGLTNAPVVVGNQNEVILWPVSGSTFYRLK